MTNCSIRKALPSYAVKQPYVLASMLPRAVHAPSGSQRIVRYGPGMQARRRASASTLSVYASTLQAFSARCHSKTMACAILVAITTPALANYRTHSTPGELPPGVCFCPRNRHATHTSVLAGACLVPGSLKSQMLSVRQSECSAGFVARLISSRLAAKVNLSASANQNVASHGKHNHSSWDVCFLPR